jgi:hypothetical protein
LWLSVFKSEYKINKQNNKYEQDIANEAIWAMVSMIIIAVVVLSLAWFL